MDSICPEDVLATLTQAMQSAPDPQSGRIESILNAYPGDARLHFLLGSALASESRLIEAHRSLAKAVEIAPDFAIARFQLGLFQLTSGEPAEALDTFGRLDLLPDGHYLRRFVAGLRCLIRDDFQGAVENLRQGINANSENPPLSRDMQLIIERCLPLIGKLSGDGSDPAMSETALLLRRFSGPGRPN